MPKLRFQSLLSLALGAGACLLPAVVPAPAQTSCGEKAVAASAIRTREDVRAFVQCAYEFAVESGTEEARRAFNEDERWKLGQFYVFVLGRSTRGEDSMTYVYPPNPSREGMLFGNVTDRFENDFFAETDRVLAGYGSGWNYYSLTNPATGRDEPKASFIMSIDWDGTPAYIGAGIYLPDLPGACEPADVSAAGVASEPSPERLQQFVRCAAFRVEERGYFALEELKGEARWRAGSIYLFGMDSMGTQFFTGNPVRVNGIGMLEWGDARDPMGPFGGRDVISVAGAFGETFLYYNAFNPATGRSQRKVGFVKRVMAQGTAVLIGSGYYLPDASAQ